MIRRLVLPGEEESEKAEYPAFGSVDFFSAFYLSATSAAIVKAESPNFGSSQTFQPEVSLLKNDPNHSLTPMGVPSMQRSSAHFSVLNSSIYSCEASVSFLTGTTVAEQASLPPSAIVASTESQNLSDSSNKA